jgi:uncharacterized membrane protein
MAFEKKPYLPFLALPVVAVVPEIFYRIMGKVPGSIVLYASAGIIVGLATGFSAAGRYLPLLKTVPRRERIIGGAAMTIAAVAAAAGVFFGFASVGFAALGVVSVLLLDSQSYGNQERAWLVIGALIYGAAVAAILGPVNNAALVAYLWQAGAASWLAVLGAAIALGLLAGAGEHVRIPAIALAAGLLALAGGEYFSRVKELGLAPYTYAVGIGVSGILAGVAFAAAIFDFRTALVWGGLGTLVYAVLGAGGFSAFVVASLVSGVSSLSELGRKPAPSWKTGDVLLELAPGTALFLAFFAAPGHIIILCMGIAAFAGAAAVSAGRATGTKWASAYRMILPWRSAERGTHGSVSSQGIVAAAVASALTSLLPLPLDTAAYELGWAAVAAASGFAGALVRSVLCGIGVLPKGAASKVSAPIISAVTALLLALAVSRLFPGT